jgi:hypothetical protein
VTRGVSCFRTATEATTDAQHLTPALKVNTVPCIECEHPIHRGGLTPQNGELLIAVGNNHSCRHDLRCLGHHKRHRALPLQRRHVRTPAPIHSQWRHRRIEFSQRKEDGRARPPIPFRHCHYCSSNLLRSEPQLSALNCPTGPLRNSLRHFDSSFHDLHHDPFIPRPQTQIFRQRFPQPTRGPHVHRRPLNLPYHRPFFLIETLL